LVIAGDGPETNSILKAASAVGLSERIHLLGRVDRETVKQLYRVSDIFIMPSHEEGSPHSLIEAMAYGLPSVSFAVGGVPDTLSPESSAYLCPYGNIEQFAIAVETLLYNKEEYNHQHEVALTWVKQFAKPFAVNKFSALLTEYK
jgi:glycosyltransferase involved in cell wall biosynthesis